MKLTVAPAMTPARAWPSVGSLWILVGSVRRVSGRARLDGVAAMREGEKRVWCKNLR